MPYRRARGYREWHCFTNCPFWPKENFDPSSTKPTVGEECPHCLMLASTGTGEWSLPHRLSTAGSEAEAAGE